MGGTRHREQSPVTRVTVVPQPANGEHVSLTEAQMLNVLATTPPADRPAVLASMQTYLWPVTDHAALNDAVATVRRLAKIPV